MGKVIGIAAVVVGGGAGVWFLTHLATLMLLKRLRARVDRLQARQTEGVRLWRYLDRDMRTERERPVRDRYEVFPRACGAAKPGAEPADVCRIPTRSRSVRD